MIYIKENNYNNKFNIYYLKIIILFYRIKII